MSLPDLADRLTSVLTEHTATLCQQCQQPIGWGDIAWNNGETESGTPMTYIEIQCTSCQYEIAGIWSWWPGIDEHDFEADVIWILEQDWT